MNVPDKQKRLSALLETSRNMLECANTGDWESVDELHGQCQVLSKALFSESVTITEAPVLADAIKEILTINKSIMDMGYIARDICMKNVGSHKHKRQAITEYTANTG